MDFMKVFDQTVREIKREVNLKVLKVPEIEQKVLDATDDEPWGPHGTILAEIAQGTKKYTECQMIMNVLWTRLAETGKNWRAVYKALSVIEYLVSHGSERAVDEIVEHTYQIASLSSFEYVEPGGKDVGINVRKKSETIVALLNDKDKIQEARTKATVNRDKYIGLSSSGLACKSASASLSSRSSDRYRGYGNALDSDASKDNYKGKDQHGEDKYLKTTKSKREPSRSGSKKQDTPVAGASKKSTTASKTNVQTSSSSKKAPSNKFDDDFDDFDPRGISSAKPSVGSSQVDLFAQNFVDLSDEPVSFPTDYSTTSVNNSSEVDLFADAAFVSTKPVPDSGKLPASQTNVDLFASHPVPAVSAPMDLFASQPAPAVSAPMDLFASQPAPAVSTPMDLFASQPAPAASTTTMDLFAAPDPVLHLEENSSKPDTTSSTFDPFAAIPMSNFDTDTLPIASDQNSHDDGIHAQMNWTSVNTNPPPKKEGFQVKSGIWADSLNRGLIDLNITAPKKVNLAEIGIVGGLMDGSESKDKGPLPSFNMGIAMGVASGVTTPELLKSTSAPALDDDFFSSLSSQQHQIPNFQK
ncbi:clathrin interactor EPSIN 1-like [Salvia miltiorrhiza]|uniref:clathrin interactor EPSIN 1-like n=1 Tax=Salvia miltiorrhiza TaxID=226208 RepID=UPI0025AC441D|nr:clathrin interactor EPSIN 1-like [Salvia miltiorrhiza]